MEILIKKSCKPVIMTKEELIWVLSNYLPSPLLRFLDNEDVEPSRLQNVLGKCFVFLMIPNYLPVKNSSFHCNFLPNSPAVFLWECSFPSYCKIFLMEESEREKKISSAPRTRIPFLCRKSILVVFVLQHFPFFFFVFFKFMITCGRSHDIQEWKRPTDNISIACNQQQAFFSQFSQQAFPPQEQRFLVLTLINMFLSTTGHVFLPYLAE